MKKYIKIIINFILITALTAALVGCNEKQEEQNGMSVYYINKEETKLLRRQYNSEKKETIDIIYDLLKQLSYKSDAQSVIPANVTVNRVGITDGIVTVDFDESYSQMSVQREVLCRAGVVLTLSQVSSVEYVAFTINNMPFTKKDGELAGAMKASDFVADLGGGNNAFAKADFVLYFANEDGTKLKEYKLPEAQYGEKTKEQFIIEQLIAGPDREGYLATLSPNLELLSIVTANNICYVDFSTNFETELSNVSNQLVIYSIVNSLSELNDIHKVQISINGDSDLKYHSDISLREPFIRNLDLIEAE